LQILHRAELDIFHMHWPFALPIGNWCDFLCEIQRNQLQLRCLHHNRHACPGADHLHRHFIFDPSEQVFLFIIYMHKIIYLPDSRIQ